jgi:hypothetical protein
MLTRPMQDNKPDRHILYGSDYQKTFSKFARVFMGPPLLTDEGVKGGPTPPRRPLLVTKFHAWYTGCQESVRRRTFSKPNRWSCDR